MDMSTAENEPNSATAARRLESVDFSAAQADAIITAAGQSKGPNADTLAAMRVLESAGFESAQADAIVAAAKQSRNFNLDVLKTARSLEAAGFEAIQADALIEVLRAPRPAQGAAGFANDAAQLAKVTYILYIIGPFMPVTGIAGMGIAYWKNSAETSEWLASHFRFQIRTFWIGGIFLLVGSLLSVIFVGILVLIFWAAWLIIRSVKGMKALDRREAHPNPTGWMFS